MSYLFHGVGDSVAGPPFVSVVTVGETVSVVTAGETVSGTTVSGKMVAVGVVVPGTSSVVSVFVHPTNAKLIIITVNNINTFFIIYYTPFSKINVIEYSIVFI
jgi:hypothetical protein